MERHLYASIAVLVMQLLHGLQTLNTQIGKNQLFYLHVYLTHICSDDDPPYVSNMYKSFKM